MQPGDSPFGGQPAGGRGGVRSTRPSEGAPEGAVDGPNPDAPAGARTESGDQTLLSLAEAAKAVGTNVHALWVRVQRGELAIHRVEHEGRTSTAVALGDILRLYMNHPASGEVPPMPAPGPSAYAPPPAEAGAPTPAVPPGFEPEYPAAAGGPAPFAPAPQATPPTAEVPPYDVPRPHRPAPAPAPMPPPATDPAYDLAGAPLHEQLDRLHGELLEERTLRVQVEGKLESLQELESSARRYSERLESRLEQTERELAESKREALTLARALGQAEGQVLQLSGGEKKDGDAPRPRKKRRWWRKKRR